MYSGVPKCIPLHPALGPESERTLSIMFIWKYRSEPSSVAATSAIKPSACLDDEQQSCGRGLLFSSPLTIFFCPLVCGKGRPCVHTHTHTVLHLQPVLMPQTRAALSPRGPAEMRLWSQNTPMGASLHLPISIANPREEGGEHDFLLRENKSPGKLPFSICVLAKTL